MSSLAEVARSLAPVAYWLRADGERVFVHCVGAGSRTPTVVAGYLVDQFGFTVQQG